MYIVYVYTYVLNSPTQFNHKIGPEIEIYNREFLETHEIIIFRFDSWYFLHTDIILK